MSPKGPQAAFCEDYDEDVHATIPETRQSANITARRSRSNLRSALEPMVDIASDSGYSSRTAATVNSTQSAPSGWKSPGPHKNDPVPRRSDLDRVHSIRKERTKGQSHRPSTKDKMQVGVPPSHLHHMPPQSPARPPRGRETGQVRHYPGTYWEYDNGFYHGAAASPEPRAIEYPPYGYMSQPSTPSVQDYPSASPQLPRYPPSITQDVHASRPVRSNRSSSYHASTRPGSIHGMSPSMGPMAYPSGSVPRYDLGPPPSSSAYANAYAMTAYAQPGSYYGLPDNIPHDHRKERSASRTRDSGRARRSSVYEQPPAPPPPPPAMAPAMIDYESQSIFDDDDESIDIPPAPPQPPPQPHPRPRMHPRPSHDRDEDYYRMPPPPLKHKTTPQVIQKPHDVPRKSSAATVVAPDRRSSRSLDMSEIGDALAQYGYQSSRGTIIPERNQSLRSSRRPSSSYHDNPRPPRVSVESSRRRPPTAYHYEEGSDDEVVDKQREAEEYQASRSAKTAPVPVPLTRDALYKAKSSHRTESDSGSQKSRSNSSRGSDARTQSGVAVGPKQEDNNIVMTMNGVTMSFTQESLGGKMISMRTGDTGALSLNIQGKRPKKYLTGGSDYSGSYAKREIEDSHRARSDRRSDRASRRSSRSAYGG